MKKFFTTENLYHFLILCFVASLCIFHGKVFGVGFIRNSQSDFLTKQFYLADILLAILVIFYSLHKKAFDGANIILILLVLTTWFLIPHGNAYSYYSIVRVIEYVLCFYILYHVKKKDFIYKTVSALAVIESVIGIIQFHLKHSIGLHVLGEPIFNTASTGIAKIDLSNGLKVVRAYGTFSHPNSLGAFLVISLAFTTYLIFKKKKPVYYLNLLIILIGITVTFSRAAFLATAIYIIGFILHLVWKRITPNRTTWAYASVVIAAIIISFVSYGTYLGKRATIYDSSTTQRLQYDKEGIEIGEQHPIFGIGYGNMIYAMDKIIPQSQPSWAVEPPHNYFIIVSDETGSVGLALFVIFLIYIFSSYMKNFKKLKTLENPLEIVSLFWLFISLLVLMQFDHYFYDIPLMALLFWMTLGIISGAAEATIT